jgi:hypothetical protein
MKKLVTLLSFNLLLFFSVSAQTYSLQITTLIEYGLNPGTIILQVTPVGFTFTSAVSATSFVISLNDAYVQFVQYISPIQVQLYCQVKCLMPIHTVVTFDNLSSSQPFFAMGSFISNASQYAFSWSGVSYYCEGAPQPFPILQITAGGVPPYSIIFNQDTIKNIAQNQQVALPDLPDGSVIAIIDSVGCVNSDLPVPTSQAVDLIVQGEATTPSDASCDGSGIRYIDATVGGTMQYQWYDKDTIAIPGQDSARIKGVCSGRYYVVATLPGSSITPSCSTMSFVDIPSAAVTGFHDQTANQQNIGAYVQDDQLYVSSSQGNVVLTIYDTKGGMHYQQSITISGSTPAKVNISTLPSDLYLYKIESSGGFITGKFSR